jgi:hypothetical protein
MTDEQIVYEGETVVIERQKGEIASLQAQIEALKGELRESTKETCDAERAFKSAVVVVAYLASLL